LPPSPLDPPQTPTGDQIFLDHVGWFVPDMEAAGAAFEALGFVLTPFVAQQNADPAGGPPLPAGTGNRCAMLSRGYLEILTTVPGVETPLAAQMQAGIESYTGLHLIAFTVDDAEGAHARLDAEGFGPQPPVHLRRPLQLPDGGEAEVAFTVLRVPPDAMEEGRIQMLRQETPELVWQDHLIARDNGVAALGGVLLCVDDPGAVSDRYARFTGRKSTGGGDYRVIDLDRGRLAFATPRKCTDLLPGVSVPGTPFMAAVALRADDLSALRGRCESAGIRQLSADDGTVRIDPADAQGAALVVFGPDNSWPPEAARA
jgi:hypothetical protein